MAAKKLTEEEEILIAIEKVNRHPASPPAKRDHYYYYDKGFGAPLNREDLKNHKEPLQPVKIGDIVKIYEDIEDPRALEYEITRRKKGYSDKNGYDARYGDGYYIDPGSGWYYSVAELVFVRHGSRYYASLEVEESQSSNLKF
jgi:hypothetical protein